MAKNKDSLSISLKEDHHLKSAWNCTTTASCHHMASDLSCLSQHTFQQWIICVYVNLIPFHILNKIFHNKKFRNSLAHNHCLFFHSFAVDDDRSEQHSVLIFALLGFAHFSSIRSLWVFFSFCFIFSPLVFALQISRSFFLSRISHKILFW